MLLDLTRQSLHAIVDECPQSLVLRTLGKIEHVEQGAVYHFLNDEKHSTGKIAPADRLQKGQLVCFETRIPIEASAPSSPATWPRPRHLKGITTERYETTTLRAMSRDVRELWRVEVRVTIHKERWLIAVYGGPGMVEIAALSSKSLVAGHYDAVPLSRVESGPEKIKTEDLTFLKPSVRNAWSMLREDSEE